MRRWKAGKSRKSEPRCRLEPVFPIVGACPNVVSESHTILEMFVWLSR